MRTSSYVIHVDLPEQDEQVLIIQGYTGAYDMVSRSVAQFLKANEPDRHAAAHGEWPDEPRPTDAATPSEETLSVLRARGYITDTSIADERERVRKLAARTHDTELQRKPNYVLMMSYDCNLRCGYCFQDHMRTDPAYRHLLRAMDRPMIDRLMTAMRQIDATHRGAQGKRQLTLFGGEPLLAENRPMVEYLLERLESEGGADIHAVTNATELHHYLDLLRPDAIQTIQVTIDGPRDEHDLRRIRPDGGGSFDTILDNLALAAKRDIGISVRINVDRTNVERLPELARVFAERGLDRLPRVYIYAAVVHATNEHIEKRDTFSQYALSKRIAEMRLDHPAMAAVHGPTEELKSQLRRIMRKEQLPWMEFRASYCGAHTTMYVIDPFGDIYACWERTGDPSIKIGTVSDKGEVHLLRSAPEMAPPATTESTLSRATAPGLPASPPAPRKLLPVLGKPKIAGVDAWRARTIATNDTCLSCKYAFYCGGGCAAEAIDHKLAYYTNFCSGFQQKFRVTAAETLAELRAGVQFGPPDAVSTCGH